MRILLDQNVPRATAEWFATRRPDWVVEHASHLGFQQTSDEDIADWAAGVGAVIVTFDEDFLDRRRFLPGSRPAMVRLRESGQQPKR